MGRTSRKLEPAPAAPGWVVTACGLLFAAVEIVVIPGAASPFRLPKDALAIKRRPNAPGKAQVQIKRYRW